MARGSHVAALEPSPTYSADSRRHFHFILRCAASTGTRVSISFRLIGSATLQIFGESLPFGGEFVVVVDEELAGGGGINRGGDAGVG